MIQIKIIGSTRSQFAVIAGGHASNQGFSSTRGVLISLVRLKTFTPAADKSTIVLGTGNVSQISVGIRGICQPQGASMQLSFRFVSVDIRRRE